MADEDPELGYKITGSADTGPIREAEGAVHGLKGTLGETATELRHLTGSSREGQEIFRGLGAAAKGGAAGIGEMIRGLRSLALVATHVIGEGPLGLLLIALGLIGGAFVAMKGHAEGAAEGTDKAGKAAEEAAKRMEAIKKAVDESFKPLDEEIKKINEHFAELEKRINAANAAAERMEKADKDLTDSQLELAKAREIDAAGGDEKKIAYIERRYAADKKVADAQRELNQVGNEGNELQVKKAAADEKAAELADAAAQANNKVQAAQESLNTATREGSRVITTFDEKERVKGQLTPEAQRQLDYSIQAGNPLDPGNLEHFKGASPEEKQARDEAFARISEARETLTDTTKSAQKANDEYAKATAAADEAALQVEREQLVTQKDTLAAINKLAAAEIERRDVDKAKVDTSETAGDKAEEASAKATDKADASAERAEKKEAAADTRNANKEAAAEAKEHHTEQRTYLELARKQAKETAEHLKSVNEAMGQVHHAAREAGKTADKITRQVVNNSLDTSP
jgi:chromosome segregation ATPase